MRIPQNERVPGRVSSGWLGLSRKRRTGPIELHDRKLVRITGTINFVLPTGGNYRFSVVMLLSAWNGYISWADRGGRTGACSKVG